MAIKQINNFSKTKRTIKNVIEDRHQFLSSINTLYTIAEMEYIVKYFIRKTIEHCILTQEGFQFPHGSGIIIVGKFKPREGTYSARRAKISSYQRNLHDPYICKWTWKNDRYTYWGNKVPSRFFKFKPRVHAKQGLRYAILNGIPSSKYFHLQQRSN